MAVCRAIRSLGGVEGKMFIPMALTVLLALLGAMIFSLTFIPAGVAIFLRGKMSEKETILIRWSKAIYLPLLNLSLRCRPIVITAAAMLVIGCGFLASRMGAEFIPSLDEGDFALGINRLPGTSLTQPLPMQKTREL